MHAAPVRLLASSRNTGVPPYAVHACHAAIRSSEIRANLAARPGAELLIHPECGCTSNLVWARNTGRLPAATTHVLSTEGMVRRAASSPADTVLVATEVGLLHRLRKEIPGKTILAADDGAVCRYMKQITLEKVRDTLRDMRPEVTVDPAIAAKAKLAIDRMLAVRV